MKLDRQDIKVFVSYSWDSDNHQKEVVHFVEKLRSEGINVVYDGDMALGERIPFFMEQEITYSDFVLYICTPEYKKKADPRNKGVGYESNIISYELYESNNERKFIPVLFSGTWNESLPIWSKGKLGIDLSSTIKYDDGLKKLIFALKNPNRAIKFNYISQSNKLSKLPLNLGHLIEMKSKSIWQNICNYLKLIK